MEFSKPEYWGGQPFPSPGYLPNKPGIKPRSLHCNWILYQLNHIKLIIIESSEKILDDAAKLNHVLEMIKK